MPEVCINGVNKQVKSKTIQSLLEEFELGNKKVAVELNREIVPRTSYSTQALASGDQIEVIHFVGGG